MRPTPALVFVSCALWACDEGPSADSLEAEITVLQDRLDKLETDGVQGYDGPRGRPGANGESCWDSLEDYTSDDKVNVDDLVVYVKNSLQDDDLLFSGSTSAGEVATNANTAASWGNHADQGYLPRDEASSTYLTLSEASSTYLTPGEASSTYLTQVYATSTYATQTSVATNYVTQADANSTYATQADVASTYLAATDLPSKLLANNVAMSPSGLNVDMDMLAANISNAQSDVDALGIQIGPAVIMAVPGQFVDPNCESDGYPSPCGAITMPVTPQVGTETSPVRFLVTLETNNASTWNGKQCFLSQCWDQAGFATDGSDRCWGRRKDRMGLWELFYIGNVSGAVGAEFICFDNL